MLKFVFLSVLALGVSAESFDKSKFEIGKWDSSKFGSYGYGYDSSKYGMDLSKFGTGYGFGYGNSGIHGGYGGRFYGYGGDAGRIGVYGHGGYGLGGGLGYYGVIPVGGYQQQYNTYGYQQPATISSAHYVAQPVVHSGIVGHNINTGVVQAHQPVHSVGFFAQHKGDVHQDVVQAAVTQVGRTVEYKNMPYQEQPIKPQIVEVEPSETPLHLHFKTKSSSVSLSQSHEQVAAPEAQITHSQDEPARLIHEIQKPVIQEVREVITPYRQITQEINPVVEAVHTVVTKAEGQRQQYVAPVTQNINREVVSTVSHHQQPVVGYNHVSIAPVTTVAAAPVATVAAAPVATISTPVTTVAHVAHPISYGYSHGNIIAPIQHGASTYSVEPISGSGIVGYGYGYDSFGHQYPVSSSSSSSSSFGTTGSSSIRSSLENRVLGGSIHDSSRVESRGQY